MKNYEWWLKQKQRVRKKYLRLGSIYYSPKESKKIIQFKKRLKNLAKQLKKWELKNG